VRAHEAYGFGFHPLTLRYTVVHVPCYFNKSGTFDAVQVYTLGPGGGASWREVPTPGASGRCQQGGVVCVDGSAYWITRGARERILSLDLEDWHVAPVKWLPDTPEQGCSYRLTEMRARLCVVVTVGAPPATRVEVQYAVSHISSGVRRSIVSLFAPTYANVSSVHFTRCGVSRTRRSNSGLAGTTYRSTH
jgi:hypothetical protein